MLSACVQLLNDEWPRSETARLHSLKQSRDSLPISLILLDSNDQLIGHVKLKRELPNTNSAFIESLIVDKSKRGKGFGKLIMNQTERLAKELGLEKLVLTTIDKIGFYQSLGFSISQTPKEQFERKQLDYNNLGGADPNSNEKTSNFSNSSCTPGPPPLPPLSYNLNSYLNKNSETPKTLMHKFI